jgi:2-hydroxychromene-2-carboxylate isomerase
VAQVDARPPQWHDEWMPKVDFWYDYSSTYSYLAASRIEPLAQAAGVDVRWRPFLLGPVFKAQGLEASPAEVFPTKGRYAWRDMERLTLRLGLPKFKLPDPFPTNSLLASRVALVLADAERPEFSSAVYLAEFGEGRQIGDRALIADILKRLGHDAEAVLAATGDQAIKDKLRAETEEALRLGFFGAPMFVTEDGEMFWGNDRLEQALEWARGPARQ